MIIVVLFFKLRNPFFLIIFLALIFQWIQINIKIVIGNIVNLPLEELFSYYQDVNFLYQANLLSNIGLIFFSFGIHLPLKKKFKDFDISSLLRPDYSTRKILRSYLFFSLGVSLLLLFRNSLPGINTVVSAFSRLKWGLLLITFIYVLSRQEEKRLFYTILIIEIFLGFTGYFSAFKDFIIFGIIGLLSVQLFLNTRSYLRFSIIFIFAAGFGLLWSAIKMDYRDYLSGGTETQRVVVSKTEAIGELVNQVSNVTATDLGLASETLMDRLSYIEFFSITLNNVPEYIDYENGKIIRESTLFYFKPRIFFPDKGIIDDSDHTNKYTNLDLVDDGKASHSIGFMTDAYIDFGPYGMMGLLLVLGLVFGLSIRLLILKSPNMVWAVIFIAPFYFLLAVYSFNMIKVMGNFITYLIPIYFLSSIFFKFANKFFLDNDSKTNIVYDGQ